MYFAITLFAFLGVMLTVRMLKFAGLVINRGVEFQQIATVFLALIPTFLEIAIPLATLLGIMLAIARLSGDSEIIVMRAAGISVYQLLAPVILFGALTALVTFGIVIFLRPLGFTLLNTTLFEIARTKSTANLDPGVFNDLGKMTLYAEEIDPVVGKLSNIVIDDRRDSSIRKVVFSRAGHIVSDEETRSIGMFLEDGEIHETNAVGQYGLTRFKQNTLEMDSDELHDADSMHRGRSPREMSLPELSVFLRRLKRAMNLNKGLAIEELESRTKFSIESLPIARTQGGSLLSASAGAKPQAAASIAGPLDDPLLTETRNSLRRQYVRAKIERGMRFSMPFASFVLALIALPLGIQPPRAQKTWGPALSVLLGVGVFVLYYAVLSLGSALAEGGKLAPEAAVWLPNLVAVLIAVYCIKHTASERWQSVAHGIEIWYSRVQLAFKARFSLASTSK